MGLFQQFPYTNFHEMNLDQIIKIMREMQDEWANTKAEWTSYKDFIDNYFATLDVSDEVLHALQAMAASGELNQIMDPVIATDVAAWLAEHITPTTPAVDASLTISGAAADAKVTGDNFKIAFRNLKDMNALNLCDFMNHNDGAASGITYTWADDVVHAVGTSTGLSWVDLYSNRNQLPFGMEAGKTYKASLNNAIQKTVIRLYVYDYSPGRTDVIFNSLTDSWFMIPADCTGIIVRVWVAANYTIDEYVKPVLYYHELTQEDCFLESIDGTETDENKMTNMVTRIQYLLTKFHYCKLGVGNFMITAALTLPPGAMLEGSGLGTKLYLSSGDLKFTAIMSQKSIIKDMTITGSFTDLVQSDIASQGSRYCIAYRAATGITNEFCIIDNVNIENFTGAGIYNFSTGGGVHQGLFVSNTRIKNCYYGIWIPGSAEYSRYVNVQVTYCTVGCENNGGNNNFTNCIFHGYVKGFAINGTAGNRGHGGCVNCAFNHIGNNNGTAIEIVNLIYGYTFTGCNIWYGGISINASDGVVFADSIMYPNNPIVITNGNTILFVGNIFELDSDNPPTFTITGNTKVKFANNYGSQTGNLITA